MRAGADQAKESAGNAGEMINEYLQQNQAPVVRKDEVEAFSEAVDETRDWADTLESRIQQLEDSAE